MCILIDILSLLILVSLFYFINNSFKIDENLGKSLSIIIVAIIVLSLAFGILSVKNYLKEDIKCEDMYSSAWYNYM